MDEQLILLQQALARQALVPAGAPPIDISVSRQYGESTVTMRTQLGAGAVPARGMPSGMPSAPPAAPLGCDVASAKQRCPACVHAQFVLRGRDGGAGAARRDRPAQAQGPRARREPDVAARGCARRGRVCAAPGVLDRRRHRRRPHRPRPARPAPPGARRATHGCGAHAGLQGDGRNPPRLDWLRRLPRLVHARPLGEWRTHQLLGLAQHASAHYGALSHPAGTRSPTRRVACSRPRAWRTPRASRRS